jgi:four helix bundle protein
MKLIAREVILQAVAAIAPVLPRIKRADRDLHEQLRSALSSAALNLGEGAGHRDGNRDSRYASARGSANEVRMALELAVAYGYVRAGDVGAADALLDRFCALTWRLSHPRR